MTKYTKNDVQAAFTLGACRLLSFYKDGKTYDLIEHMTGADAAPEATRRLVTNDEMMDILRSMSEVADVSIEMFFHGYTDRLVIYNQGRSYGVERQMDKNWKFDWDDFLKNGFTVPD